ncbi:hypothetical protein PRZ48_009620 [Zasmidium cellare]|uniref:Uncharacterized protein n=1 Tax=Zasmidium cellare TaxID=395010 RepID=A0ABR0EDA4_ZASCE|nr:hypothetical protein PRZ48_009620 [Zasmidium cellare]
MEIRFNSACSHHVGKCKCSLKRIYKPKRSDVISNGTEHKQASSDVHLKPTIRCNCPISAVDIRISRLIKCIENLGMDSTPIVYLPSRIGECDMLDIAAEALIHLSMGSEYGSNTVLAPTSARSKYARSMSLVRKKLNMWNGETDLDALIGTTSLLGLIDVLSRDGMRSKSQTSLEFMTHWNGISNLLLCSAPSAAGSTPSPFEAEHWLAAEPADLHPTTSELRAMNICSHRLSVRLPRLVALVRQLRELHDAKALYEATSLSELLYECQESAAESWILRRTRVFSTSMDSETSAYIPSAMAFASAREMTAAVLYWQSRIVTTRIYNLLHNASHTDPWDFHTTAEELQLANNILMAWPYGNSGGFCVTAPFALGFVCVWLVCRSIPNFHGLPTEYFADWIMRTLDVCHGGWAIGLTIMDLDAASDILIGGPLIGHLADIARTVNTQSTEADNDPTKRIGQAIAIELAKRGASVLITYNASATGANKTLSLISQTNPNAKTLAVQADSAQAQQAAEKILSEAKTFFPEGIDIIVNNAAEGGILPLDDVDEKVFDRVMHTNVLLPLLLYKESRKVLRKGVRIVNISSIAARTAVPFNHVYAASKAALESITRCMAMDLGRSLEGTANAVNPGPVSTDMQVAPIQTYLLS